MVVFGQMFMPGRMLNATQLKIEHSISPSSHPLGAVTMTHRVMLSSSVLLQAPAPEGETERTRASSTAAIVYPFLVLDTRFLRKSDPSKSDPDFC